MGKKSSKNEPDRTLLSDYEYDSLWMSYRYCIGRHTIASHAHASDIALNVYHRLTNEQKEFTCADINECIYDCLRISTFFYIENFDRFRMNPLEILYEFINSENISSYEELGKYKKVVAKQDRMTGDWSYEKTLNENNESKYISSFDIEDLEIWQKLVKLLDYKTHFIKRIPDTSSDEPDKMVDVECYHYYTKRFRNNDTDKHIIHFDKLIGPIDRLDISQTVYLLDN